MSQSTVYLQPSHQNAPPAESSQDPRQSTIWLQTQRKRSASPSFEGMQPDGSRKRHREDTEANTDHESALPPLASTSASVVPIDLESELAQELECPCCSALVYRPVVVSPCQHFFCGSCCSLWIQNGGTNCPACRGASTVVAPSRPLQIIIDTLLRVNPSRGRTERERQQADLIYSGTIMRFPSPREASPPLDIDISHEYIRPCSHCAPGNVYGWNCPQPVPDPSLDLANAWRVESGLPPGHLRCGHCENLLAVRAPVTSRCDFCQVSFCGLTAQARCCALPIERQEPHSLTDLTDLVQSTEMYDCFEGNSYEVDILLEYLSSRDIKPRRILADIVEVYRSTPEGFRPLINNGVFTDIWSVEPTPDPNPNAPRRLCCRMCAAEILLSGLRGWWTTERTRGSVRPEVLARKDCPSGASCHEQTNLAHAKDFNHILAALAAPLTSPEPQPGSQVQPPLNAERKHDEERTAAPDGGPREHHGANGAPQHDLALPFAQLSTTGATQPRFHPALGERKEEH